MPKSVGVILAILVTMAANVQANNQAGHIDHAKSSIGGVALNDSHQDVLKALGNPLERHEWVLSSNKATLSYEGITIELKNGHVTNLNCWSDKYSTPDGIKVGDERYTVIRQYGEPFSILLNGAVESSILTYLVGSTNDKILFHLNRGKVAQIELWSL